MWGRGQDAPASGIHVLGETEAFAVGREGRLLAADALLRLTPCPPSTALSAWLQDSLVLPCSEPPGSARRCGRGSRCVIARLRELPGGQGWLEKATASVHGAQALGCVEDHVRPHSGLVSGTAGKEPH